VFRSAERRAGARVRTPAQHVVLIVLRSLIGWHFLYEGYYKWAVPGWNAAGQPVAEWTAGAYLATATGPLAGVFHWLASGEFIGWVDVMVVAVLIAAGVSLMLGLFTQVGASIALALLTLFYVAHVPLAGGPAPGTEGTYLLVNKTLIEWAAVLTLLLFRTGRIAGLDLLFSPAARTRFDRDTAVSSSTERGLDGRSHGAHT
jgi:thiosulfate dehydrogenase [quinone] large subunit